MLREPTVATFFEISTVVLEEGSRLGPRQAVNSFSEPLMVWLHGTVEQYRSSSYALKVRIHKVTKML